MEKNQKEEYEDESRILEKILSMIFQENMEDNDLTDSREKSLQKSSDGQVYKESDEDESSELIYCRDPYEFTLFFTPGDGGIPIRQKECWRIITSGGEHQITKKFGNGKYLISYDERHVFHTGNREYVNGPVLLIALDGSEFTRDMDREDICYLSHQLECRVRKNVNGKAVLLIEDFIQKGKNEEMISS